MVNYYLTTGQFLYSYPVGMLAESCRIEYYQEWCLT